MSGAMTIEEGEILDLLDLVAYNLRWDRENGTRVALWRQARFATRFDQWNWARRSKRNVAHHHDLGDSLYAHFLDAQWQYSCAYYVDPANDLEHAQRDKLAHIAAKLLLTPGQRVLDIGCGWGGLALYLNRVAGVDVLGITLAEDQLRVARQRAEEAGVAGRVRFELLDYRALTGSFDRIVSVGMLEHVGVPHYREYFDKIAGLLTPDGVALVHTIGRVDGPARPTPGPPATSFPAATRRRCRSSFPRSNAHSSGRRTSKRSGCITLTRSRTGTTASRRLVPRSSISTTNASIGCGASTWRARSAPSDTTDM